MLTDPIADLLTRIRNAQKECHRYVDVPLSKMSVNIAKVLEEQGFVKDSALNKEKRFLRIYLKYEKDRTPMIRGLKRASKLSLRRYVKSKDIPDVLGGMGSAILSTNRGIMDGQSASEQKLGGEILCYVW